MSHQPLPLALVERLFARFSATWGAQKLAAMFPVPEHENVKAIWAESLGRYERETLRVALQNVTNSGREWPPSLSEFLEACRVAALSRRQHAPAQMLDVARTPQGEALENLKRVGELVGKQPKPGREWAHKILVRRERGESVPMAVYQLAKRALA